jgi:hypothetical protein
LGPRTGFGGGGMFMPGGRAFGRPFIGHPGFHRFAFHHHHGFGRFAFAPLGLGDRLYGYDEAEPQSLSSSMPLARAAAMRAKSRSVA